MSGKFENILYNIAPLILIIAVSWFFSFLASKARKQTGQPDRPQPQENRGGLADVFFEEDDGRKPEASAPVRGPSSMPPVELGERARQPRSVGPQVTAKPIKPKWWGA
jgi:hypothetical protein